MKKLNHIQMFENFGMSSPGLEVGDVVFIKPTEAEFTVVAVDPTLASKISRGIELYAPDYEMTPIKLIVSDPLKNYVLYDVARNFAKLVSEKEAMRLNMRTGDYLFGQLNPDGSVGWVETSAGEPDYENPKYIVPVMKNEILFADAHGTIMFMDDDIETFYKS